MSAKDQKNEAHMTISFSYAYLKGLERLIVSSPWVVTAVQRPRRATSPRRTGNQLIRRNQWQQCRAAALEARCCLH